MADYDSPSESISPLNQSVHTEASLPEEILQLNPRAVLEHLLPGVSFPSHITEQDMLRMIMEMLSEPPRRQKLPYFNTLDDVLSLLQTRKRILVVTGAGVRSISE